MNQARASNRYLGKAALKTHALQTLTRRPLPWPARSVWSASDLSALSVRRGTASGSWPQCTRKNERGLSMNPAGCCRHLAGRGIREQLCRRDVGSTLLAALFDSFEVQAFYGNPQKKRP